MEKRNRQTMKKTGAAALAVMALLTICRVFSAWGEQTRVSAIVMSDLHYTCDENASDLIVSGMAYADEIADLIVQEVIDRKPDVLILTGDNTNSGRPRDVSALVKKLQKVRDAGIFVVITTGNHDFDHMDPQDFEDFYSPLIQPSDRDADSFSYTCVVGDTVFLAMDDNAVTPGGPGLFSRGTMDWMKDMLDKYRKKTVIFLSHHNVLLGKESQDSESYRIRNPDLAGLLEGKGVPLALTGHFHAQMILEENTLHEIVSGMPYGGAHLIGFLTVDGNTIRYKAEPVDFEVYGAGGLLEKLKETDERNNELQAGTFAGLLSSRGVEEDRREILLGWIGDFLQCYTEGTMGTNSDKLRTDPVYAELMDAIGDHVIGKWMQGILEANLADARYLEINLPGD